MAEPVIPGLNSDGTMVAAAIHVVAGAGAGVEPEADKGYLLRGQTVTVNGVVYTLDKYLGGGTYGKVWSANGGYSIKFINVQYDSPDDTETAKKDVINEARLTKKLHDETSARPICSNIHGIGITPDDFVIIVMDKFSATLDKYLDNTPFPKRKDELVVLLYRLLLKVNQGDMKTSHGDVKGDNFMLDEYGELKAVDLGFGHIKEGDFEIICNSFFNSQNIGINRDIVQFVVYLRLFYKNHLSDAVSKIITPIIVHISYIKEKQKKKSVWSATYYFLADSTLENSRRINNAGEAIINQLLIEFPPIPESPPEMLTVPYSEDDELPPVSAVVAPAVVFPAVPVEASAALVAASALVEPPAVFTGKLPAKPTTIAATIKDKTETISNLNASTIMKREESVVPKSDARNLGGVKEIPYRRTVESGYTGRYGGARKTRRHSRSRKTRKRKSKRKTRSK